MASLLRDRIPFQNKKQHVISKGLPPTTMPGSPLMRLLAQSAMANQYSMDLRDRQFGLFLAICVSTDDPLKRRRIRVTTGAKGGLTASDWMMGVKVIPGFDPPIPPVGSTVVCGYLDGNPHDGVYLGSVINQTNPEFVQTDPQRDNSQLIPGESNETVEKNLTHTVNQNENRRTEQNLTVEAGKTIVLQNDAGASITVYEQGAVVVQDAYGNTWSLGGVSGGQGGASDWEMSSNSSPRWNLNGNSLNIVNAGDVTINGKSVATVGALDTGGDTLINRGW